MLLVYCYMENVFIIISSFFCLYVNKINKINLNIMLLLYCYMENLFIIISSFF